MIKMRAKNIKEEEEVRGNRQGNVRVLRGEGKEKEKREKRM